jgi:hypothetical protein
MPANLGHDFVGEAFARPGEELLCKAAEQREEGKVN